MRVDRQRWPRRGRALAQRERLDRQRKLIEELTGRVAELEAEVQECRGLSRRIAEVTDLVAEVLLPAVHRDDEELRRRLEAYAEKL